MMTTVDDKLTNEDDKLTNDDDKLTNEDAKMSNEDELTNEEDKSAHDGDKRVDKSDKSTHAKDPQNGGWTATVDRDSSRVRVRRQFDPRNNQDFSRGRASEDDSDRRNGRRRGRKRKKNKGENKNRNKNKNDRSRDQTLIPSLDPLPPNIDTAPVTATSRDFMIATSGSDGSSMAPSRDAAKSTSEDSGDGSWVTLCQAGRAFYLLSDLAVYSFLFSMSFYYTLVVLGSQLTFNRLATMFLFGLGLPVFFVTFTILMYTFLPTERKVCIMHFYLFI
jgi:hypothetical protein